jgi:hypothetical protein
MSKTQTGKTQTSKTIEALRQTLQQAQLNQVAAHAILNNPVAELAKIGVHIPTVKNQDVIAHLPTLLGTGVHKALTAASEGKNHGISAQNWLVIDDCTACKFGAAGLALAMIGITTVGAGGALTVASPEIAAVAAFFGMSPAAALALADTAVKVITVGVTAVATNLCVGAGICRG